jgi:SagB-type dehydrogenase family enzyme
MRRAALSTLLNSAYGVGPAIEVDGFRLLERPIPSAGARYPLEIYLLVQTIDDIDPGTYHYDPVGQALQYRGPAVEPARVAELFLGQPWLERASAVIVLTAVLNRTLDRYGDRGYRYVLIEAGHLGQNLNLVATGLGLGSLDLGGFFDAALADRLCLSGGEEVPIYAIAVGMPSTLDRTEARRLG